MVNFRDPSTRVRIDPDACVAFDGSLTVALSTGRVQHEVRVGHDVLVVLHSLVQWTTIANVLAEWDPADHPHILALIDGLHSGGIISTSQSIEPGEMARATVLTADAFHSDVHIDVENHYVMLRDHVRVAAYQRAIERAVTPTTVALDLGCGSGILSLLAARCGAPRVYAVERRAATLQLARELAVANDLHSRIEFIAGGSNELASDRFDPRPTLLIAEIIGNGILDERVLECTIDARDRFLAPAGRLIPYKLDICVFAYSGPAPQWHREELDAMRELYGFDLTPLGDRLQTRVVKRLDRYNVQSNTALTAAVTAHTLDLRVLRDPSFRSRIELTAIAAGPITGFCAYFKAHLDENTILTNSPWAPATHWTHVLFTPVTPRMASPGERLVVDLIYDGALRVATVES